MYISQSCVNKCMLYTCSNLMNRRIYFAHVIHVLLYSEYYIVVYTCTIVFIIWIRNKLITWTWLFVLSTTIKVQILDDCSKQNHRGLAHFGSELYDTIYINGIIQLGPKGGFTPVDRTILLWPGNTQLNRVTLTVEHSI